MTLVAPLASVATTLPSSPPVTMRDPSAALARMPPPCAATRRSPSAAANNSVSSPRTNTGVAPRKCTPTTGAPASMRRTRSAREGSRSDGMDTLSDAAFEALPDLLLRQLAADEDDAAFALLAILPRALMIAVEDHVHALEHEALGVVLEGEDALAAQDVLAFGRHQVLHPGKELVRVQRLVRPQRYGLHVFVVVVLEAVAMTVAMMVMIVPMMIVVVMMMIVVIGGLQELRLDVEDAVEVEGIAAEHLGDVDLRTLGTMQPRIRVQAPDARLELEQLARLHEIGLVDQNHVGKGDLVLGLRRVLQAVLQPFGVGDRHHGVELGLGADRLVHEKGLRHWRRIGQARRLDDDGVELAFPSHQPVDDAHEVAAHGAADAPVVHLEHFFVGVHHQLVVDADLAELVDDHGVLLAVRFGQDAVEQRGLAGAEIAGKHGDGDFLRSRLGGHRQ